MEIRKPKDLTDGELLEQRVLVYREMARLTLYLDAIDAERVERCADNDNDAVIIPLFK